MQHLADQFTDYLKTEKKASANTLQSYRRDIDQYLAYLRDVGVALCTEVTPATYLNYMMHLQRQGKAAATISRSLASTRAFYKYLCRKRLCDADPTEQVHTLKTEKKMPRILSGEEIRRLLAQPSATDLKGIRDKAMLELLYATGMRVSELISLNVSDVNPEVGYALCKKSMKERVIPLYPGAADALRTYMEHARGLMVERQDEPALFVNTNGMRMTRQGFWKIMKHYVAAANIHKDITPHTLRHSFAAHLLENGADLKSLQEMMGHADISSTQVYANILKNKINEVYKSAHPMARNPYKI